MIDFPGANPLKPIDDIQKIIDVTAPFAQKFNAHKGEILRYFLQKKMCYILHSGSVTLNRRGDGMVINSEQAPLILGTTNQLVTEDNLYLRVTENSVVSVLTLERFNLIIESAGLWKSLCKVMAYSTSRVYEHCSRVSHMTSRELILLQLKELMNESERVRSTITASNYICDRTYLSRSNIMRILAELRDAGQITLTRGILISINSPSVNIS